MKSIYFSLRIGAYILFILILLRCMFKLDNGADKELAIIIGLLFLINWLLLSRVFYLIKQYINPDPD